MSANYSALIFGKGEGEKNTGFGFNRWFRVRAEDTDGAFCIFEEEIPEGAGPPLHIHTSEYEVFTVLSGSVKFHHEGEETIAAEGTTVTIPPGAKHTFKGIGPGMSRVLVMLSPGHGGGIFLQAEAEGLDPKTDKKRIDELGEKYGVQFVGPPIE